MTKRQVAQHKPETAMTIGGPLPRGLGYAQRGLAGLLASVSVSAAALALVTVPQHARAQSAVNGTPTVQFGADAPTRTATQDSFNVTANDALIDWAVTDNSVFLNPGTTLSFSRDGGAYTVLNRVASAPVSGTLALSGRVQSDPQGKIWFYNPGGWVVGSGATIDVGSLVLTANPIQVTTSNADGQKFLGPKGEIRFGQALAGSSVTVQSGATISTSSEDSYVALVAPRVVQAGTVINNGSTAYVAAGAVDITINNGLFDIVVSSGTDDANGVVHAETGTTFGSTNSSSSSAHRVYLAAVPKNDAMTMLVSGNIGYNSASSASTSGGKIVLSAGYDVVDDQKTVGVIAPGGSVSLNNLSLQSTTQGYAGNTITVDANFGSVSAAEDLALTAAKRIDVVAFGEGGLFINGPLALNAGAGAKGGIIDVSVDGGAVFSVGGDFDAHADGLGAILTDPDNGDSLLGGAAGEAATGGSVKIALGNAFYDVAGQTLLSADATGGLGGASAGSAKGGSVSFSSTADASLSANRPLDLSASASALTQSLGTSEPDTGAGAVGGTVDLGFGGSFVADNISAMSLANAKPGTDSAAQDATGGSVSLAFTGASSMVNVANIDLSTSAEAVNGGVAAGGTVTFKIDGAAVNAPPAIDGEGGTFQPSANVSLSNFRDGAGPNAGSINFSVVNAGTLDLAGDSSTIDLFASASATSGTATGAAIAFTVDGGTVSLDGRNSFSSPLSIASEGDGDASAGGMPVNGRGGDVTVTLRNGGSISSAANVSITSRGSGASGSQAGDGTGGTVLVSVADGSLSAPAITVGSYGFAGSQSGGGTRVGTGTGGSATLQLTDLAADVSTSLLTIEAPGQGGGGRAAFASNGTTGADGGNGQGGTAALVLQAGSLSVDSDLTINALGVGGNGSRGGNGGTGKGGDASLTVSGGNASLFQLTVAADGHGGRGGSNDSEFKIPAGDGGAGVGGTASALLDGGNVTVAAITLSATGNADPLFGEGSFFVNGRGGSAFGDGPETAGKGGDGTGGTTRLTIGGGSLANVSGAPVNSISLDSRGVGGVGGNAVSNSSSSQLAQGSGGNGNGGIASFALSGGSADFQSVNLAASGSGGASGQESGDVGIASNGGNGGSGEGGKATITLGSPISSSTSFESTRSYTASVGGEGADGGSGARGGSGGDGKGGSATLTVTSPDVFVNQIDLDAFGSGGTGGSSGLGNDGGAGGSGTGGNAGISAIGAGVNLALVNGSLYVAGQGGNGGSGGSGDAEVLDAAGNGGNAGAGSGGQISFTANDGAMVDFSATSEFGVTADGSGGTGGDGGNATINSGSAIGDGGNGGDGSGGAISVTVRDGTVLLGDVSAAISGTGGNGGGRLNSDTETSDASRGGNGGNGLGGSFSLSASGSAGSIQANSIDVHVDGQGGSGADAQGFDPVTFGGASGGSGGAGTGGAIRIEALERSTITFDSTSTLTANGTAAFGGIGADGGTNPGTGAGGNGGTGGNSGQGNGGTVNINAEGGLIETGDLTVFVNGFGAAGRQGGQGGVGIVPPGPVTTPPTPPAPDGAPGDFGIGGGGVGGVVFITAQRDEGGFDGGLNLGAVTLDLRGLFDYGFGTFDDAAGRVEIVDRAGEDNGGFNLASLDITASGNAGVYPLTLSVLSLDRPIRIANGFGANAAGSIEVTAVGTGGLEVGGEIGFGSGGGIVFTSSQGGLIHAHDFNLNSQGVTLVSAQSCAGPLCPTLRADNQFLSFSGDDFGLLGPALIEAGNVLQASSRGNVTGDAGSGYRAPDIFISAQNDVTIRNASGGGLDVEGGLVLGEGFFRSGNVTLGETDGSGVFDLSGSLYGAAGTDLTVLGGTKIGTGNAIELVTGDDLRIGAGATLTNTTGGAEPGFIRLDAGGLASFPAQPTTNITSLIVGDGAVVDGTGGSVELFAGTGDSADGSLPLLEGAIDGRGAIFRGASFTADVRNVPPSGTPPQNDGGQLSAPCLSSDICLGAITATDFVRVGQGPGGAPIHFAGTGNISGASVAITSRDTLTYGAAAWPFTITSAGPISLTSQAGDLALVGNALINGGTVALSAAAGSVIGNGRLHSAGDIGIDVGANIALSSLVAARQLATVAGIGGALEPLYTVPGHFAVTSLQTGAPTAIRAGGSILIGTATTGGNDLSLTAGSLVSLGADSNVANLALNGGDVAFAAVTANGNIVLSATNAISGTSALAGGTLQANGASLNATTLRSGGAMTLSATGATTLGTATSGSDLSIDSGALTFTALTSTGATTIDAASIVGDAIAAGTSLDATAGAALALGTGSAGTTLTLNGQTIGASMLRSGGTMALTSSGATTLGTATSGANLTIASAALTFDGLTSTGSTALTATSVAGGNIAAGTGLTARASGALVLGTANAGTTLALDGATLRATTLTSGGDTLASSGAAQLGTVTSGGDLSATTGDLSFARLASTGATALRASSITGGDIAAGKTLSATTPGALKLGSASAGASLTLNGASIEAASLNSGGATGLTSSGATMLGSASAGTTFTATSGAFQFAGITAGGEAAITASTVSGGDATSTTGAFRISASGVAALGQIRAGTDVSARATTLTFAGIDAGRDVTLDVTTLAGTGIVTGRDLTIRSTNDLTFGTIAAGRNLSLDASQGAITVNTDIDAGGTITLTGDAILVKAAGPLTIARVSADNGDIAITTDGLLQVANAASRGDVTLTSTASSLILGPIVAGRSLASPQALNSSGTSKGTPGPGAITLSAAQAITMQGTVDALTSLAATAGTLIDQRSLAVGKTIAYRSADIALGQTAALGQSNFTTGVALTNTGSSGALLGDVSVTTSGYRLDNTEFGRIHSGGDLSLAAGASLTVGALAANAATGTNGVADGNIGGTSMLALSTSGDLAVGGALSLTNAAGNTLRLSSGSLTLDAGAGSVRLIEGSGHGGTLAISTGELSALTSAARSAIVGMDANAINLRLAQNDGVTDGRTLLEAGAISIAASGRVLIQNTALGQTFDARRGFVADTFAISTANTPLIVINGTVGGATGLTALRAVSVTGGFDELSTVNGCRLLTATCGTPQFTPIQDVIEDEIGRGTNLDSGDAIGEGMLIQIERFEPVGFEAVIDEPVTGSGNDDFLVPEAGTGDQQCQEDDKTKCDKPPTR